MTSEAAGLLDAIVASPDDDAPRLVYADWLQGQNDPRGEFIQLQCQLAAAPDDERRRAMRIAENKLLKAHEAGWLDPLRALLPEPGWADSFKFEHERGFVERAQLTMACVPRFDALFAAAPMIRELEVTCSVFDGVKFSRPDIAPLLASPHLAKLRKLTLNVGGGGDEVAEQLAACEVLANLTTFELHASVTGETATMFIGIPPEKLVLGDAGITAIAGSPHFARLEHLLVEGNLIGPAGIAAIANGAWRLRTLDLARNAITLPIADALRGPATATVEILRLAQNQLPDADVARLVALPELANVVELDLESCGLGAKGTALLCEALALPALRRLRLERNSLADAGGLAVASSPAMARLTSLEMGHNRMGAKAGAALAASPHLANLERLTLNEPRWKAETEALFGASPTLANARIYLKGKLVARKSSVPPKPLRQSDEIAGLDAAAPTAEAPAKKRRAKRLADESPVDPAPPSKPRSKKSSKSK